MTEDTETPREILRRMDLVMEQTEDKGTEEVDGDEYHRFGVTMRPNPERYEKIEEEDREGWCDTLDDIFIPIDTFKEAWESIDGMPIYFSPPEIGDMGEYTSDRREKLRNRLESGNIDYNFDNESTKVLEDLSSQDDPYFVIIRSRLRRASGYSESVSC